MAGENQNTGPNTGGQSQGSSSTQKSAKELKDTIKELIRLDGDYRDILRDSVRELQSTLKTYDKIEAKLVTINRSALNLKEIESNLKKVREEAYINQKKLNDLNEKISESGKQKALDFNKAIEDQQKAEETLTKARLNGNQGLVASAERNLISKTASLENLKQTLNIEQLSYAAALKRKELDDEILSKARAQKEEEERIQKSIGVTGFLAKSFADKLGVGETYYKKITEAARDSNKELTLGQKASLLWSSATDALKEKWQKLKSDPAAMAAAILGGTGAISAGLSKMGDYAKKGANALGDFMSITGDQVIGKITSGVSGLVKNIPLVGGLLGGLVEGFGKLLELSLKEDDKIAKIGRNLGVSKEQARSIQDSFISIANNSGKAVITSDRLMASQMALNAELGTTNVLSSQILKTDVELANLAGIDAKTRAGIAQSSIITGKSSEAITKSVLAQVGGLKAATGISLDYKKVLSEASGFSGVLGLQFAKYPEKLSQSLVSVKSMGMELQKLDSMADQFLNFEQSISKEFEAQLLTGKNINLAKAREAFLNNDLATAAKEITRQVGNSSQFLKMNRIQQQSFAESMGMSREDLADMLKKQEAYAKLGATDLKSAQAKVEALKAQGLSQKEISEKIGQDAYNDITRASAQEKIAGFLEKIQNAVGNFLSKSPIMALIDKAMKFLEQPDSINKIVEKLKGFFAFVFDVMGTIAGGIMKGLNLLPGVNIDDSLIRQVQTGGAMIRSMNLGDFSVGENAAKSNTSAGGSASPNTSMVSSGAPVIYMRNEGDFQFRVVEVKMGQSADFESTKMNGAVKPG